VFGSLKKTASFVCNGINVGKCARCYRSGRSSVENFFGWCGRPGAGGFSVELRGAVREGGQMACNVNHIQLQAKEEKSSATYGLRKKDLCSVRIRVGFFASCNSKNQSVSGFSSGRSRTWDGAQSSENGQRKNHYGGSMWEVVLCRTAHLHGELKAVADSRPATLGESSIN